MINGTGYNVVIGFATKAHAQHLAKEIREKHNYALHILKIEAVE